MHVGLRHAIGTGRHQLSAARGITNLNLNNVGKHNSDRGTKRNEKVNKINEQEINLRPDILAEIK